jgi:hypothetical protein
MFSQNLFEYAAPGTIRQIDLSPILLEKRSLKIPSQWDGACTADQRPAYMLTPRPSENTFQFGLRKNAEKLIRTYDQIDGTVIQNEYYDLETDPEETDNRYNTEDIDNIVDNLQTFINAHRDAIDIDFTTGIDSQAVEDRLKRLGYK